MIDYRITMIRSPGITESERRNRLREAFDVLLAYADRKAAPQENTPTTVIEATATASESGEMESTTTSSLLRGSRLVLVKEQEALL